MSIKIAVVSVLLGLITPGLAEARVGGKWKTTEGTMVLKQRGIQARGRYGSDNGVIAGTVRGNLLTGNWIEDSSGQRCKTPRDGRYYWGMVRFVFSGNRFTGHWGYCTARPTRTWKGTRIGAPVASPAARPSPRGARISGRWKTTEGTMVLKQRGIQARGRYGSDNGVIAGTVRGNLLTGNWIEDSSGQRCKTPRDGRYYWGMVRFVFSGNRFTGHWGYCTARPTKSWKGTRVAGGR